MQAIRDGAGMYFGPAFQWVDGLWRTPMQWVRRGAGAFAADAAVGSLAGCVIHPGLLDGCFRRLGWRINGQPVRKRCMSGLLASGHFRRARLEKSGGARWKWL